MARWIAISPIELGDELVEFEGVSISTANQFTNLICTLPESWPASLTLQTPTGQIKEMTVRLLGLPYKKPKMGKTRRGGGRQPKDGPPSKKEKLRQRKMEMIKLLSAKPGTVRNAKTNQLYTDRLVKQMRTACGDVDAVAKEVFCELVDVMQIAEPNSQRVLRTTFSGSGRWIVEQFETADLDGKSIKPDATPTEVHFHDGESHFGINRNAQEWEVESLTEVDAKLELPMLQATIMASINNKSPLLKLGSIQLDGSDRCLRSNAFRFRVDDADEDPLYLWAVMKPDDAQAASELRKVSASLDCLEGGVAAGVTLEKWQQVGSMSVPLSRKFVAGLDEEVDTELVNLSAQSLDEETFETRLKDTHKLAEQHARQEDGDEK